MANKDFKVKNGLDIQSPLPVSMGGTGQTSTTNTLNSLLPSQSGNQNKVLSTDGTNTTWAAQAVAYQRGGTASRPQAPIAGDLYYNTDTNVFEQYTSLGWFPIAVAPGIPTGVTATNQPSGRAFNNGRMSVAFTPNTSAGAPSSFVVTPTPTTSPSTFTGTSSPITVTGLASSTQYTYTVSATSAYGTSSASSASTAVTATTVPQAPTINTVTGGSESVAVAFTAGATGGSSITGYTVTSSPGNITATGSSSPITVTGLTDGTSYTFTMTATNTNGTSLASSASNSITPNSWIPEGSYDALASTTLSSGVSSITFNGIPADYKHLQIRFTTNIPAIEGANFRFNNDGSNNYRNHYLVGAGGNTTASYADGGANSHIYGSVYGQGYNGGSSTFTGGILDILDYSSSSKNKTVRSFIGVDRNGSGAIQFLSGVWLSPSPINQITFFTENSSNLAVGTNIAIYGVK